MTTNNKLTIEDIKIIKELLEPLATKEFVRNEIRSNIDSLAIMINNGFDETATKQALCTLKSEVVEIDKKVQKIDERVQSLTSKVDKALYTDNVNIVKRIKKLEQTPPQN